MEYLIAGLFDWVHFSTDRLSHPVIIVSLVLIALGIIFAIFANPIGNTAIAQKINERLNKSETFVAGVFRISGYVLIFLGCIIIACTK